MSETDNTTKNTGDTVNEQSDPESRPQPKNDIPSELPILPLRNTVAFPFSMMPLSVGIPRSVNLVNDALKGDRLIGLVGMKYPEIEEPLPGQTYEVGTIAKVEHVTRSADNSLQVIVQGIERFRIDYWMADKPYLKAHIAMAPDKIEKDLELDALQRSLRELAQQVVALSPKFPKEVGDYLSQVKDPRYLVYLVASGTGLEVMKAQQILEIDSLKEKYRLLIGHLTREKEVLTIGKKIESEAREEMSKAQREYYLRQQLRAIQKELGESEPG